MTIEAIFYIANVVNEWSRTLNIKGSDWSCSVSKVWVGQGRAGTDPGFQVRGGALKKIAPSVGVFRVKNHDFTPKNHMFSNFRGGGARRVL